ncbi:TPA: RHS repeat-associated core domain-containing protein [Morganella morganii]
MISALHTPVAPHEKRCFVEFSYDPPGRRLHKAVNYLPALSVPDFQQRLPLNAHPEGTTTFLWEGLRLLEERRPGNTRMLYVYEDSDSYSPLARIDFHHGKEDICYYRTQPNGLPDSLHDEQGETLWEARFTSWGRAEVELGTLHYLTPQRDQNLRFQGQYLDRETGLHYNTFRYYDPDTGRFTQHDPIGLAGGLNLNLYQYAPNPLGWVDPWGWVCSGKTSGGKGLGGNQKVDRAARELDSAVQRAGKYPDRGGHMNTTWGKIYQKWANNQHIPQWLKNVARGNAIQQVTDKLTVNNRYLEGIIRNKTGSWWGNLRPDYHLELPNGKVAVFDITTPGQAAKIGKYKVDGVTNWLINILY